MKDGPGDLRSPGRLVVGVELETNLPDEVVLSNYFSERDGEIVSLTVVFNQPSPYTDAALKPAPG